MWSQKKLFWAGAMPWNRNS
jgi:hypothetical protein